MVTRLLFAETFGVERCGHYIAPKRGVAGRSTVTISLGVGENPAKRIAGPFEAELLRALVARGAFILIDKGAGGEEAERVEAAIKGPPPERIQFWARAFAPFAAPFARSDLFIGYDSAGQ